MRNKGDDSTRHPFFCFFFSPHVALRLYTAANKECICILKSETGTLSLEIIRFVYLIILKIPLTLFIGICAVLSFG